MRNRRGVPAPVAPGIDVLPSERPDLLMEARVGIVAGPASVTSGLTNVIDALHNLPGVRITALFGPEHGVRGDAQAGVKVGDETDPVLGVPVYSLYGEHRRPTAAMLQDVDVLVVDLFDVGCRYWTYLYTMAYVLEAAAEHGKKVVVLDRPNPVGGDVTEGNVLDPDYASFVGLYPIAMRTGLTFGEAARLFNAEFGIGADLEVIEAKGWRRGMWHDETGLPFVPPSPNTPTVDTLALYPGTCLFEGTNLSEGRGTTKPFELIGAPWIDARRWAAALNERQLPGVAFRPAYFVPTFSKHQGEHCRGVQVHITDRAQLRPVAVALHMLHTVKQLHPEFAWRPPYREGGRYFIDLLAGGDELRLAVDRGEHPDDMLARWDKERSRYDETRARYLLYTEEKE